MKLITWTAFAVTSTQDRTLQVFSAPINWPITAAVIAC